MKIFLKYHIGSCEGYSQWGFAQLQNTDGIFVLPIHCSSDFGVVTAAIDNVYEGTNPLPVGRQAGTPSRISFEMQNLSEISVICICKA